MKTRDNINAWNTAVFYLIYKKGDPIEVENYKGISLLDTTLYTDILNRFKLYISEIIDEYL